MAKDAEQCSPYLEHTCEEGHESTVACGLYTLPVVLRDDGKKPRSCPIIGIPRFLLLQVLQESPLCAVLWSSLQHLITGLLLSSCSLHPSSMPLHDGPLPLPPARLHRGQGAGSQVCLLAFISLSSGAQEASFMTTWCSGVSASNVAFYTRMWEEGDLFFHIECINLGPGA